MKKYITVLSFVFLLMAGICPLPVLGDETALFTAAVPPDLLIILDLSGSMADAPDGGSASGTESSCLTSPNDNCSKINIAKAAIFKVLDANSDGKIDSNDMSLLNIRIGFMRYTGSNCDESDNPAVFDYTSGCNRLINGIDNGTNNGTTYSKIYCGADTSCASVTTAGSGSSVRNSSATGGTPLAASLAEALLYMNANKTADSLAATCRQKFVLIITDGEDTYACNGNGSATQSNMNRRRAAVVTRAKALADAGYKVFVIGFGSDQSTALKNTLNWAAFYGGTDNPNVVDSLKVGDPGLYTPPSVGSECSTSGDPGSTPLSGYAFIATGTADLKAGLQATINKILEGAYSFSQPYIAQARTADENYIYQASFEPQIQPNDPLWTGHLKRFSVSNTGVVTATADWDAGAVLQNMTASSRSIKTYLGGTLVDFYSSASITPAMLGLASGDTSNLLMIRNFVRGGDSNAGNNRLGDIFDSNLAVLGTPPTGFTDILDLNNAYTAFRTDHSRTTPGNTRIIIGGANDGQLHAFKTGTGEEAWSFIPPNTLPNLKLIAHASHPTLLLHTYMVDGPVTTLDAWWCSSCDYTHKDKSNWHSLIVFGLGKGSSNQLWSTAAKCDANSSFSPTYDATYKYFCGYYALEATTNPSSQIDSLKWTIRTDTASGSAPYLGQPWSKMSTGRVRIGVSGTTTEKWVGIIGGGYNPTNCTGGSCDTRGKGIFVIDLETGAILKAFTKADYSDMKYSFPAQAARVDRDFDGFIDAAYIGDMGGNIWRIKMCKKSEGTSCDATSWTASRLYDASGDTPVRPIYTKPVITRDPSGNIWVYWGTGDAQNPTDSSLSGQFYGLKDDGSTYTFGNLQGLTGGSTYAGSLQGWRLALTGTGEKILGDPDIYGGILYFTTFIPAGSDLCSKSGTSKLYSANYLSGAASSFTLTGSGIASGVMISTGPGTPGVTTIFYGYSGAGPSSGGVGSGGNIETTTGYPAIRYWLDRRAQ
jgi:type IV pilus assembly protein PilY1